MNAKSYAGNQSRKGLIKATIHIIGSNGHALVRGYMYKNAGLAITRIQKYWTISHIDSGMSVTRHYAFTFSQAAALYDYLMALPVSWNESDHVILDQFADDYEMRSHFTATMASLYYGMSI